MTDGQNPEQAEAPTWLKKVLGGPIPIGNALFVLSITIASLTFVAMTLIPIWRGAEGIAEVDFARGLITLIFVGGTMLIAIFLVIFAITSSESEFDKKFSQGKEVLTILIGILGAILGFYFGKAQDNAPKDSSPPSAVAPDQVPESNAKPDAEK